MGAFRHGKLESEDIFYFDHKKMEKIDRCKMSTLDFFPVVKRPRVLEFWSLKNGFSLKYA